jgi:hypothetical protein
MSLHALANHMAAQGRNNDSMLVHMTPKEVGGLHALAIANGGQLTINPETGLPEAGFLEDLLPAIVGFGLDMFLPGLGEAVGGAFGLSAAAGTGIAVGGLTGLATGNLSKGVMAGFGAYGGAGLAEGLVGAGVNAATNAGTAGYESILADKGFIPGTPEYGAAASDLALSAQKTALAASPMDRLTAGFSASTQNPSALLDFGKNNWKYGVAAAAPALMGGLSEESQTVTPMADNRMITPFVMNRKAVPRDNSLSPSAQQRYFNYDVTPITPVHAANGGAVQHFDGGGSVNGGENFRPMNIHSEHETDPFTQQFLDKAKTYQNTMTGDSASAFDYLMGNTRSGVQATTDKQKRPGAVRMPGVDPTIPATPGGIQDLADIVRGGGGASVSSIPGAGAAQFGGSGFTGATTNSFGDSGPTTGAASVANKAAAVLGDLGFTGLSNALAKNVDPNYGHEAALANAKALAATLSGPQAANPMGKDASQNGGDGNGPSGGSGDGKSARDGGGFGGTGSGTGGDGGGAGHGSQGQHAAHGGYLDHGQFNRHYADGGVTGGGNIDLHVPISIGGGGRGMGGETFGGGNGIQQGGTPQSPMGGLGGLLGGLDPKAAAANPQGFSNFLQGAMAQEKARPGSTMFSNPSGVMPQGGYDATQMKPYNGPSTQALQQQNQAFGGSMGGMRYGAFAEGGMTGMADGGLGSLGGYSDGGRLLRGPGDGVSDSIPATIGQHQPARLADGEFVVPARIVSELGNGSTEAGARQLYAMMDRIQAGRKKTVGKNKVAANTRAAKHLPA